MKKNMVRMINIVVLWNMRKGIVEEYRSMTREASDSLAL